MLWRLLAEVTFITHLVFIIFAVFGALLYRYRVWGPWLHLPVLAWASWVNLAGWVCPLTPLENYFLARAGEAGYATGFIEHYLVPIIYPGGLPENMGLILGIGVLVWNAGVYALICGRRHAVRKRS